jgi:hypothetical protein
MKHQHQHHQAHNLSDQLTAFGAHPGKVLTAALNDPSGHLPLLAVLFVGMCIVVWMASLVLGGFGKAMIPAPNDKRGLFTGSYEAGSATNAFVIGFMRYASFPVLMFILFYFFIGPEVSSRIVQLGQ